MPHFHNQSKVITNTTMIQNRYRNQKSITIYTTKPPGLNSKVSFKELELFGVRDHSVRWKIHTFINPNPIIRTDTNLVGIENFYDRQRISIRMLLQNYRNNFTFMVAHNYSFSIDFKTDFILQRG